MSAKNNLQHCGCRKKRAVIVVGFKCINDCHFCVAADKRDFGDKSTEDIMGEMRDSWKDGAREVLFTGGECSVREDIFELVAHARTMGFEQVYLQTNGRMFSSMAFCEKILLAGMTIFNPALHGPTAEIHDRLTRAPGSFRQTVLGIHNIRKIARGRVPVLTNSVVTKINYPHLPALAELLASLRVTTMQFAFVHAMGHAGSFFDEIVPRKTDAVPYIREGIRIGRQKGVRVMVEAVPFCLLQGYEDSVSELYIPPVDLWDKGWRIEQFEIVRKNEAKMKFPQCRRCIHDHICEGPWREYPEHFGSDEFQPVERESLAAKNSP